MYLAWSHIYSLARQGVLQRANGTLLMLLVKGQRSWRSSGLSSQLSFNVLAAGPIPLFSASLGMGGLRAAVEKHSFDLETFSK